MSFLSELSYVNQKTQVSADVIADGEITVTGEYDNETLEHLDKRFHGFLARLHSAIALNLSLKLQELYENLSMDTTFVFYPIITLSVY